MTKPISILCFIAIMLVSISAKGSPGQILKGYLEYCNNKVEDADRILGAIVSREPDNAEAHIIRHFLHHSNSKKTIDTYLKKYSLDEIPENHIERLIYAKTLFLSKTASPEEIFKVLNFSTEKKDIEASRLFMLADLNDTLGLYGKAYIIRTQALSLHVPVSISWLAYYSVRSKEISTLLKRIPKQNPHGLFLKIVSKYEEKPSDFKKISESFNSVILSCPEDQALMLDLAKQYMKFKAHVPALSVLDKITSRFENYNPLVDYFLSQLYFNINKYGDSEKYYKRAIASRRLLSSNLLVSLEQSHSKIMVYRLFKNMKLAAIIFSILAFMATVLLTIHGFRERKKHPVRGRLRDLLRFAFSGEQPLEHSLFWFRIITFLSWMLTFGYAYFAFLAVHIELRFIWFLVLPAVGLVTTILIFMKHRFGRYAFFLYPVCLLFLIILLDLRNMSTIVVFSAVSFLLFILSVLIFKILGKAHRRIGKL